MPEVPSEAKHNAPPSWQQRSLCVRDTIIDTNERRTLRAGLVRALGDEEACVDAVPPDRRGGAVRRITLRDSCPGQTADGANQQQ
jgi:hypothetical protein